METHRTLGRGGFTSPWPSPLGVHGEERLPEKPSAPIRAIETTYNGYRFRSRLEARWAVFFDALGIKYWYEPEGFELDAGRYLPDFFLPQVEMYAEVKATELGTIEWAKAEELAYRSGHNVILLIGPPDLRHYDYILVVSGNGTVRSTVSLDIDFHRRVYYLEENRLFSEPGEDWDFTSPYRVAIMESRGIRFEEGCG